MKHLIIALVLFFAGAAAAQYPSQQDGIGILPDAVDTQRLHVTLNAVDVGRIASRLDATSAAYTNATATPSTILTVTLPIATWHCHARVVGSESVVADGISVRLNTAGLTASAASGTSGYVYDTNGNANRSSTVTASGATSTFADTATWTSGWVDIDTVLTVTVAGALVIDGAQRAHSTGILTVNRGSYLYCQPL